MAEIFCACIVCAYLIVVCIFAWLSINKLITATQLFSNIKLTLSARLTIANKTKLITVIRLYNKVFFFQSKQWLIYNLVGKYRGCCL